MGLAKRYSGRASAAPPCLQYVQPGGFPLTLDPGETIRPSKSDGWVEIVGEGRPRYARADPIVAEKPRQLSLFD